MRIVTGDEVGLLKVTTIRKEALVPMPNKKLKSNIKDRKSSSISASPGNENGDPTAEGEKEPVKPLVVTRVFGAVDRNQSIQLLAQSTLDADVVVVARSSGLVECVSISTGAILRRHQCFIPTPALGKDQMQDQPRPRLTIAKVKPRSEHFIGLHEHNGVIIACTDTGSIFYLHPDGHKDEELPSVVAHLGMDRLCKMRVHPKFPHIFATGGEERELCVWDIKSLSNPTAAVAGSGKKLGKKLTKKQKQEKEQLENAAHSAENGHIKELHQSGEKAKEAIPVLEPIWSAKNVRNDFLDMRVPVWVTEIQWIGTNSPTCLAIGTGYHQVRKYDTSQQRRPILDVTIGEHPIKTLATDPNGLDIIFADTTGQMMAIDGQTGKLTGKFLGIAGAVTQVVRCLDDDVVVSIGIDRKMRLFEGSGKRRITKEVYLKQRLSALLVDELWQDEDDAPKEGEEVNLSTESAPRSNRRSRSGNSESDDDALWESLPAIKDTTIESDTLLTSVTTKQEDNSTLSKAKRTKRDHV
ncbi:hypothetical protein BASA50_003206 [Batrachochytrium salamandrivorans]|uniref:Ribosome biogenesis protein NSA1 n=1 Tax=Batrachochytrium salamandrivorans TaxID=1357716 RepID=A0ABQ8FJ61_9FUNG|nr:hypothetical protein BASA60_000054 [Batrachochytrium salamandrivorans]KAH6599178.1 hypothetical protein BASA50_003206 [Batrachochytrium salamandrivorans]